MNQWEKLVDHLLIFVSNSDSKTEKAFEDIKSISGIVQFALSAKGIDIEQAVQNKVNILLKDMKRLSEDDFKKLFVICHPYGIKLGGKNG